MKLLHIADLHLGKKVNEVSMLDEQKHSLNQVLNLLQIHKPDYLIMAGDIYDKSVPSVEAMDLFDEFLFQIAKMDQKTIIISGNHDSAERLGFAKRLFKKNQIYISTSFDAMLHTDEDMYGKVDFYMVPFIKPNLVRRFFDEPDWKDYTDMFESALNYIDGQRTDAPSPRKVLIAHQFITGATRSDSEEINVGGLDNISAEILTDFDYVALGHIHGPQKLLTERIRYSGSIYKYSFSEEKHQKCALLIELGKEVNGGKCEIHIEKLLLNHRRDFRTLKGEYASLTLKENYKNTNTDDYIRVILTDEEDQPDAFYKLRAIYPNLMSLEYDNARTRSSERIASEKAVQKSPLESFEELFYLQNNRELNEVQKEYVKKVFEDIFEEK